MDHRNGYPHHMMPDSGNNPYLQQTPHSAHGYAPTPYMAPEYHMDPRQATNPMSYHGHPNYQPQMPQYPETQPYDPRLEPARAYQPVDHSRSAYHAPHMYQTEPHHEMIEHRSSGYSQEHDHRSRGPSENKDRSDRHGSRNSSYSSSRGRREERSDRYGRQERSDSRHESHRKGGRGPSSSDSHSSYSSRQGDQTSSRAPSESEYRGKKKLNLPTAYAAYFRSYSMKPHALNTIDLKCMHPEFLAPMDLVGLKIHWHRSISFSPSIATSPPIPINFSIPMSINNEIVPSTWSVRPPSKPLPGSKIIQVRVLLIRGSPIDISAPKSGSVHSNNNIMFLCLERGREGRSSVCAPGGLYDPLLDDPNAKDTSKEPSEKALIRTAIRTVKEQLTLDLSGCNDWYRFMDVEYAREGTDVGQRVVYMVPSVWEALPSDSKFAEMWREHRKIEIQSEALMQIERLKNRLSDTEHGTALYGEIKAQITQKEEETKFFTSPPPSSQTEAVPDKPMLLIRVNPSATNGQRASTYTLQNLLELDVKRDSTPEETIELFLFAHRFDEFLQYYFGSSILLHVAMMRDYILQGQRPFVYHGTPILINSNSGSSSSSSNMVKPNPKKRGLEDQEQTSSENSMEEHDKPLDALLDLKVKREIKEELEADEEDPAPAPAPGTETSLLPPGTSESLLHQPSTTLGSYNEPKPEIREAGVPLDSSRDRPPKMPEHRDYRLMQAFRYFDLNRLGYLQGEDLINIFLSLDLGISRKVAAELAAAADSSLPHYPFIHSGFSNDKHVRYKPVCDWLHSKGLQLPTSE